MAQTNISTHFAVLEVETDADNPKYMKSVKLNGLDISKFVQKVSYSAGKDDLPEVTITLRGYIKGNG